MQKKKPRGKQFTDGHKVRQIYDEPLSSAIKFRLLDHDYEKLKAYCDRHNIKVSALLRELVEDFLRTVPDP
jgi:hypothetical protein